MEEATTIRVYPSTKQLLEIFREHPRETHDDLINKLIKECTKPDNVLQ